MGTWDVGSQWCDRLSRCVVTLVGEPVLAKDRNREATNLEGTLRERSFSELAKGLASSTVCCRQGLWLFDSVLLAKEGRYAYNAGAVTFLVVG